VKLKLPDLSQKELIQYLVKNKLELIDCKKSAIKNFVDSPCIITEESGLISKAVQNNQDTDDTIYRTVVGNTYNWMDSHDDMHLNGLFGQSIKDRNGRIYHRHDHVNQLTAKVGKFLKVYEQNLNWTDVGVNKAGQTMALLGDSAIKKAYNQLIFDSYKDGEIDQHSVGMQYSKIYLAVNDRSEKEEYDNWMKYFPLMGNPEKAIERGFFWAVKEAKLIEISCVTEGSNELTGMYNPPSGSIKNIDPQISSQEIKQLITNAFKN
jgi:hypothetical protein